MSDAAATIMKARQLIDGASLGPKALKAIGQAFDKAWLEIAGNFGDEPGCDQANLLPRIAIWSNACRLIRLTRL